MADEEGVIITGFSNRLADVVRRIDIEALIELRALVIEGRLGEREGVCVSCCMSQACTQTIYRQPFPPGINIDGDVGIAWFLAGEKGAVRQTIDSVRET